MEFFKPKQNKNEHEKFSDLQKFEKAFSVGSCGVQINYLKDFTFQRIVEGYFWQYFTGYQIILLFFSLNLKK